MNNKVPLEREGEVAAVDEDLSVQEENLNFKLTLSFTAQANHLAMKFVIMSLRMVLAYLLILPHLAIHMNNPKIFREPTAIVCRTRTLSHGISQWIRGVLS